MGTANIDTTSKQLISSNGKSLSVQMKGFIGVMRLVLLINARHLTLFQKPMGRIQLKKS
jgi:hypothetical protein